LLRSQGRRETAALFSLRALVWAHESFRPRFHRQPQYKEGLLGEGVFASFSASWRQTLAQPGVRALWTMRRHAFEAGFAKFMDRLMAEAPKGAPADFLTAWKAEAAKEIAALHDTSKPK